MFSESMDNVLAVEVYQPDYSHFAYIHRGAAGLLAYLVCDGQVVLLTDTTGEQAAIIAIHHLYPVFLFTGAAWRNVVSARPRRQPLS